MQINSITPNFQSNNYNLQAGNNKNCQKKQISTPSFAGENSDSAFFSTLTKPFRAGYDKFTDGLAKCIGKLLNTDTMKIAVEKTSKSNIVAHITCATALIVSGVYVKQTLSNKKLDKAKRTTLAINQASVAGLSAVMGYTLDGLINKKIDKYKLTDKFAAVNAEERKVGKYIDGIKCAVPIIVFGTVYRFITPVLVTPVANWLGGKLQERDEAKVNSGLKA